LAPWESLGVALKANAPKKLEDTSLSNAPIEGQGRKGDRGDGTEAPTLVEVHGLV